jgi:hypothetical protein
MTACFHKFIWIPTSLSQENKLKMSRIEYASIDAYIRSFPEDKQKLLNEVRAAIKAAAPDATERISYQIPTKRRRVWRFHYL